MTWAASSCEPANENVTFVPGCSLSYAVPAVLKTSVSEDAARTVRSAFGAPDAEAVAFSPESFVSSLPQAASGTRRAAVRIAAARTAAAGEGEGHEGGDSLGTRPADAARADGTSRADDGATPLGSAGSGAVDVHAGRLDAGGGLHADLQSQLLDRFPGQE
ncbi:hypothetical protein GCM10020227_24210 [Streptomyces flavovirens]